MIVFTYAEGMMSLLSLIFLFAMSGCFADKYDPDSPGQVFVAAKEKFTDGDFERAIASLGQFKSRFPYHSLATEAELLIADAYYGMGSYDEALIAYQKFVQLHPRHPKRAYAMFRVGQSYWVEAPEEIDREQEQTQKALLAWQKLIATYPTSEEATKAEKLVEEGERRVASSFIFIADFYCAQGVYHACAYRHIELAETFPRFRDIVNTSYRKAVQALEKVLVEKKKDPKDNSNIYLKNYTAAQLTSYIASLRKKISDSS